MRPPPERKGMRAPARERKRHLYVAAYRRSDVASRRDATPAEPVSWREQRGRRSHRFGFDLEDRVIEAFAEAGARLPTWFRAIRPSADDEDHAGVDLWVTTATGDVPVQIKSSAMRARMFLDAHPGQFIGVAVVHPSMTYEKLRVLVLAAVAMAPCQTFEAA